VGTPIGGVRRERRAANGAQKANLADAIGEIIESGVQFFRQLGGGHGIVQKLGH